MESWPPPTAVRPTAATARSTTATTRSGVLRSRPRLLATLLTALLGLASVKVALRTPESVWSALLRSRLLGRPRLLLRALKRGARRAAGFAAAEIIGAVGIVYVAIQHLVAG